MIDSSFTVTQEEMMTVMIKKDSVIILYGHAAQEFDLLGWC